MGAFGIILFLSLGLGALLSSGSDDGVINGTDGDDELTGTGGDDILNGLGGNDTLRGGAGDATLNGGDGSDVLAGWHGNDTLDGGAGVDQFVMGAGADHGMESYETSTITDFDPATESIEILHPTEQTPDSSMIQLEQDGVDTLVILTDPDTADRFVAARLSNVSTADIQAGSILFSAA